MLILMCGDVKPNPGPNGNNSNSSNILKICCSNVRSLNEQKLDIIQLDLAHTYDIICLK